jgi:integrase
MYVSERAEWRHIMRTNEIITTAAALYERMTNDGYSQSIMATTKWVIEHFEKYCRTVGADMVDMPLIAEFLDEKFGIDCYARPKIRMQSVLRRPLLILMEFYESGNYCKTHLHGTPTEIPLPFADTYLAYRGFVNGMGCSLKSKERKLWIFTNFLARLERGGIKAMADIAIGDISGYVTSLSSYAVSTTRCVKTVLREALDWMHGEKIIAFSGRDAFPLIKKDPRTVILSYYSKEEIERILSSIDTSTTVGKTAYFIVVTTAFLGIRAGDLVNLKFSDINWENGCINIVQRKTGRPIALPLVDEVKFALLDYMKNARPESNEKECVLISPYAPHARYLHTGSAYRTVSKCIEHAGIDTEGRHHGPHALRHSLATNLMSENVPLSAIANILGHASTRTTEIYLTVDETHLKELSLEVPNGIL